MTLFSNLLGMSIETGVFFFYCALAVILIAPRLPGSDIRGYFYRLLRLVFFPSSTITFPEVLLADALTSMSKVLKDVGVTCVAVYAHYSHSPIGGHHEMGMVLVAALASLPFW